MKNKFERLNKVEKKQAIKDFKESNDVNKNLYKSVRNLFILGIIGVIYSSGMLIYDCISYKQIWAYIVDGFIAVAGVVFIILSRELLFKSVNKYLVNNKK